MSYELTEEEARDEIVKSDRRALRTPNADKQNLPHQLFKHAYQDKGNAKIHGVERSQHLVRVAGGLTTKQQVSLVAQRIER